MIGTVPLHNRPLIQRRWVASIHTCMMRPLLKLILALSLALAGCDQEALFETLVPKEEATLARQAIAQLAVRDYAAVESLLSPSLRTPDVRGKLEALAGLLPSAEPKGIRTVGAHTNTSNAVTTYDLTLEYDYQDAWLIANIVLERRDGKVTLQGMHFTPRTMSLEAENAFTLSGRSALHYAVLAAAIAIPLFIVYVFVVCIRTRIPKRKWLWLLFVAVGLVQFQFNWATGAWGVQPFGVALLGAGFAKAGPVAPYVFTLAFPLGAVLFLARRRSFARPDDGP